MLIKITVAVFLLAGFSAANADLPSTYESSAFMDAYIDGCGSAMPEKAQYYKRKILESSSCGEDVNGLEISLKNIREDAHPQVRRAYLKMYNLIMDGFKSNSRKQNEEMCDLIITTHC